MHIQPLSSNDTNNVNDDAWYMNRVSESGIAKTPINVLQGNKQRSIDDILGLSLSIAEGQCDTTDLVTPNKENGSYGLDHISSGARTQSCVSRKPWTQLFADDNEEMEKMTLQDMQRSLRKGIGRSLDKVVGIEPSSSNHSHSMSGQGIPRVNSEAPSVGLELLLEDSTSNSSDNMSLGEDPAGISSSRDASRELLQEVGPQISGAVYPADLPCGQKRASMVFATAVETEIEDDEWTLQKWQLLYHKKHSCRKKLKKHCKLQEEICESIGKVCSNGPPSASLDTYAAPITASEVGSMQIASCHVTSLVSGCKLIKENCETDSSECKHNEGKAYCNDALPHLECAPGYSSQMQASLLSHSTVSLELEDGLEITTSKALSESLQTRSRSVWALKPCNKVQSTPVCKSGSSEARVAIEPISQTPFRKACDSSDFYLRGVYTKLPGQRKQPMMAEIEGFTSSFFPINAGGPKHWRTSTMERDSSQGVCKSKALASKEFRHIDVDQVYSSGNKDSISKPTEQLQGAIPLEQSESNKLSGQSESSVCQLNANGLSEFPAGLNCIETLEIEEEQELQQKPAKIPCKRKAISPMSQEFLLKASKMGEYGANAETRGMKRPSQVFNEGWVNLPKWRKNELSSDTSAATGRSGERGEALQGSLCHSRVNMIYLEGLQSNASLVTPSTTQQTPSPVQKISLVLHSSPSQPQNPSKALSAISPPLSSPSVPAKGILRSCSQACLGPCGCEECASVRSRAERASEFSQRQMQDIEGLAVKLMKDLSILRNIVEDRFIQSSSVKNQSPRPALSLDQLKKATGNALETEETAKKWLIRMARDCNRYCKIMRMQGRKLSFADESGGKLCHVKVFHSEPPLDSTTDPHGRPLEVICSTSSVQNEPAVREALKESELSKAI